MKKHSLTTEQVQKFFDAVGAKQLEISGGQFTAKELLKLAEPAGGFNDWPKHTDCPVVNHVIDCITAIFCKDKEPEYDEKIYLEEIEAFKALDQKEEKQS